MAAKLVAEEGTLKGLILSLEGAEEWTIGRDPDVSSIVIEDPSASRQHLICHQTAEGITIQNLSTTNPIQVNDEEAPEPRLLEHGDRISIGNSLFRFYAYDEAKIEASLVDEEGGTDNEVPRVEEKSTSSSGNAIPTEKEDNEGVRHDSIFELDQELPERANLAEISFGMIEPGRWLLKVVGGPNSGAEFSLQAANSYTIGTDPNTCDIIFHDTSVSRQQARITIDADDHLFIEDLQSRNGTFTDGKRIETRQVLEPNSIITTGTTSFVVYDREGKMQTIISPFMPSIAKTLQEAEKEEQERGLTPEEEAKIKEALTAAKREPISSTIGAFILIGAVMGLFAIVGLGVIALFQTQEVRVEEQVMAESKLSQALTPFPSVRYSYNKGTGRLLLVGHVMTVIDKNQLTHDLQGLPFIKSLDDMGIVIDEYVWKEANQYLSKNPNWKGINIHSPSPGRFVVSGYLKTKKEGEELSDYLAANFPYLDLLEKRIVVEENIVKGVTSQLQKLQIQNIKVEMADGELSLTGAVPSNKQKEFAALAEEFKKIPGVRSFRNFTTETAKAESMVNVSDRYEVAGFSHYGTTYSVVIDGRIMMKGDTIDGMIITEIAPHEILLEKAGVMYRINF